MPHSFNYKPSDAIAKLEKAWQTDSRWQQVKRPYTASDVIKLRGSINQSHMIANLTSRKLWHLFNGGAKDSLIGKNYINTMGTLTGGQAIQQAKAGMSAWY